MPYPIYLILILLGITTTAMAGAEMERFLTQQQIKTLLTGNTLHGLHIGAHTRQYFSESGTTLWLKEGDNKPREGRWKIVNNQYCSQWRSKESWSCYHIVHDKMQEIYYFTQSTLRIPFIPKQGYQINF